MSTSIEALEQEIIELTKQVDVLADQSRYEEADSCQKKLEGLKKKLVDVKKLEMKRDHESKQAQLREAYKQMERKFSVEWDEEMKKFEIDSHQLIGLCLLKICIVLFEDDMKKRHENEVQALEEALEREPSELFRPSSELTNLRTTEKQLAKLKKFVCYCCVIHFLKF
jgi:hypothetical protein